MGRAAQSRGIVLALWISTPLPPCLTSALKGHANVCALGFARSYTHWQGGTSGDGSVCTDNIFLVVERKANTVREHLGQQQPPCVLEGRISMASKSS